MHYRRDIDFSLSTAAILSARFPYVTPAGWIDTDFAAGSPLKRRLVDGGYFENSGVATALDMYFALSQIHQEEQIRARIIILHIGSPPSTELGYQGLGEFLSPIRTLLNTRGARGRAAVGQARHFLRMRKESVNRFDSDMRTYFLDGGRFQLPLGWSLSEVSRDIIRSESGNPQKCKPEAKNHDNIEVNNCVSQSIFQDLSQLRSP